MSAFEDPANQTDFSAKPIPPAKPPAAQLAESGEPVAQGEELLQYVLDCLDKGSTRAEICKQLVVAYGYSDADADRVVESALRQQRRQREPVPAEGYGAGGGNTNMWVGGLICLVGIVITVGSCMAAGEGGGSYIVAWGAILFGGIQFFRGLLQNQSE